MIDLGPLARPNTVSIFASDPTSLGKIVGFLLTNVVAPIPGRVRLDLTHNVGSTSNVSLARSPVERAVIDNIRLEPRTVIVAGQLSANPLGVVSHLLGAFGSIARRDLRELAKLKQLQARREPVILVTPTEVFPSMAFNIQEEHTGENKVELALSFHEVRIVHPATISAALDLDELLAGAGSEANMGGQPTSVVDAPAGVAGGLG